MAKGISVLETEYTSQREVERFYSDDEIAELFPDGDGSLVGPLLRRAQAAEAEIERLRAIVDQLPRTRDGAVVVPLRRVTVFRRWKNGRHIQESSNWSGEYPCFRSGDDGEPTYGQVMERCDNCYSTREAAEAAKEK